MNYLEAFHPIKGFIFDVDGVFTNNNLLVLESGQLLRTMNTRDGLAIKMALEQGYFIGIITGGSSEGVVRRFRGLGIECIHIGVKNKRAKFQEIIAEYELDPKELLYMGDDLVDYEVMRLAGLAVAPADAVPEVLGIAGYICSRGGGQGCVREVIEKCLKIKGQWPY